MKELFYKIAIVFAKRKKKKDKQNFLKVISNYLDHIGISSRVEEIGNRNSHCYFLIVGNPQKDKTIVFSGYDTQNRTLFGTHTHYPLYAKKCRKSQFYSFAETVLLTLLVIGIMGLVFITCRQWLMSHIILSAVFALVGCFTIYRISSGIPNYINYQQSGSLSIWLSLAQRKMKNVCFVLLDDSAEFHGFFRFAEKHSILQKRIVYLGEYGYGEKTILYGKHTNQRKAFLPYSELHNPALEQIDGFEYISMGFLDKNSAFYTKNYCSNRNRIIDFDSLEKGAASIAELLQEG